jgi:hypothetical protein
MILNVKIHGLLKVSISLFCGNTKITQLHLESHLKTAVGAIRFLETIQISNLLPNGMLYHFVS